MNYRFQFGGVDTDCQPFGDGALFTYSSGTRVTINENAVNESEGLCGSPPIDWNGNGVIQNGIQVDVNPLGNDSCSALFSTLTDYNDWAGIILATMPGSPGAGAAAGDIGCQPTPTE
jgi:hypothetical protein